MAGDKTDAPLDLGVVLGWNATQVGDRIVLKIQSTRVELAEGQVEEHRYFLTRSQAGVLANYLFQLSGFTRVNERRSWWTKLFR